MGPRNIVLELRHVFKQYNGRWILFDLNLEVLAGEIVSLVGPSGCGKSTLLRAILGTDLPSAGQVVIYGGPEKQDGRAVGGPSPRCCMIYQGYCLSEDRSALENVALGPMLAESGLADRFLRYLPLRRTRFDDRRATWAALRQAHLEEAAALLDKLGMKEEVKKYPYQLSGGQRQRVAIAQALIMRPRILLMDEPFASLDEKMKEELKQMLLMLYDENIASARAGQAPTTTYILVTHEIREAVEIGDRVVGLTRFWDSAHDPDARAAGAATFVYDKVSPVFPTEKDQQHEAFAAQRNEIRQVVIDETFLPGRDAYRTFWKQVDAGEGRGVLNDGNRRNP